MSEQDRLEQSAIEFFRAIHAAGKEIFGHDNFGFKLDINTMSPPNDKEAALRLGAKIQEALTVASNTVRPITIEGTTMQ